MQVLSEGQLRLCVVQPVHLTSGLLIFLILKSISSLKPARLPVYQRKPFIAAWNAPTDLCLTKYNLTLNLKVFQKVGSPRLKTRGQDVVIFYVNKLGYYPCYTSEGLPINGGLPQNTSLQLHLEKAAQDINYYIPSENFSGLAVIDWEYWRPQWARNWNTKDIYRQKSRILISDMKRNISAADIEYSAKTTFEKSAKAFMEETIKLGIKSRPKGLWGYYLYPDCHNYNVYATNSTGSCPEEEVLRNNGLSWLWNSSTALYPAVIVRKSFVDSENTLHFSRFRLLESLRISTMTSHDYALPVFVYTQMGYKEEPLFFLSKMVDNFSSPFIYIMPFDLPRKLPFLFCGLSDNMALENRNGYFYYQKVSGDKYKGWTKSEHGDIKHCTLAWLEFKRTRSHRVTVLVKLHRDLISTIGESAALGAAGFVIWGDMNLTSSEENCTKVNRFVNSDFGSYIINVTRAAEVCSRHLCKNNGRCVRKAWNAAHYLHLNPASYHIEASEDGEFIVKGRASGTDLALMEENFLCHCYEGYEGANCREMTEASGPSVVSLSSSSLIILCLLVLAG